MANLATVQEQIKNLKDGKEVSQKDIFDAQAFIAIERRDRPKTIASLETFFTEWEQLIVKKNDSLRISTQSVLSKTGEQLDATRAQVGATKSKEELKSSVDEAFQTFNMKDIDKMKQGLDKLRLALNVPGLSSSDKDAIFGYTGKMLIARIEQSGYKVYLQDKKVIIEPTTTTGDRTVSTALASMLNQDSTNLQSIATGLLYGSSQFANFVAVNSETTTDGKKTVKKPTDDYFTYLRTATNNTTKTLSDKALIQSESAVRNTLGLTPEKMQSLMTGHMNTGDWIKNNPVITGAVVQSVSPKNISSTTQLGSPPHTSPVTPSAPSRPTTWKENPIGKLFGEAGTSVINGFSNLMSEPGALAGVLITFISTWIFADFKTAMQVLGVATGASAAYDAYKRNKDGGNNTPNTPAGIPNGTPTAVNVPTPKTIDKSKIEDPSKLKAVEKLEKDPQIVEMIAQQRKEAYTDKSPEVADLADYIDFIHSDSFQQRKANDIVNPIEFKSSMFSDKATFDKAGKNSLNNNILKRVLRIYFTGSQDIVAPVKGSNLQRGEKEKNDFITAHTAFFNDKNKTVSDLTTEIYK